MKPRFEMFMDWIEQALPYGYITTKGDIVYVHTLSSVWRFNKTDMTRFGKIILFHRSENHLKKTGELQWHKQGEMRSGYYTLFYCFVHDKFKELGIKCTTEDYQSFSERFEKWYGLQLIKEYFEEQDKQEILENYEVALSE